MLIIHDLGVIATNLCIGWAADQSTEGGVLCWPS